MKMLRRDARSIAESVDTSGAPNIRYLPSGATIALKEKQVKITQVYIKADTTMLGSISQTASIRGPVDIPVQKANPLRYMNRVPSSLPSGFRENANIHIKAIEPRALRIPPSKYPLT